MAGRSFAMVAAAALLAVALGCGGGGGGGKPRTTGPDPAKVMAENTAGAARSCILQVAKDRLLLAQARRVEVGQPLDEVNRVLETLQRDGVAAMGWYAEAYKQELARVHAEASRLSSKLGPQIEPLDRECQRLTELRQAVERSPAFKAWDVVSHDAEEANEKTSEQRTSLMVVKVTDYRDVLGEQPLRFRLFWRKSVQTLGFGRHKEFRELWDLRRAEKLDDASAVDGAKGN